MSITKQQLVELAYGRIGLSKSKYPITPELMIEGVLLLDGMVTGWGNLALYLGYASASQEQTSAGQESGVPDLAWTAITSNLALEIAPLRGKATSSDLRTTAANSLAALQSRFASAQIPSMPLPRSLPRGAGNKPYRGLGGQFFQGAVPVVTIANGTNDLDANGEPLETSASGIPISGAG